MKQMMNDKRNTQKITKNITPLKLIQKQETEFDSGPEPGTMKMIKQKKSKGEKAPEKTCHAYYERSIY